MLLHLDSDADQAGKKKILFLTGTRAEFGKLKPLIQQIKDSELFDYSIFATGMHMLSRYGSTVLEIERAGFKLSHRHDFLEHQYFLEFQAQAATR